MNRLLMIDDHVVVRRGLRSIIEEELPDTLVAEGGTAREGLDSLRKELADAGVLDIGLPDRNGLEVLKRIHKEWPSLPVLILSMYDEDQYGIRVMRAGASGYLTKASAPENLVSAIRRILNGGRYVSPYLARSWPPMSRGRSKRNRTSLCQTGNTRFFSSSLRAGRYQRSPMNSFSA